MNLEQKDIELFFKRTSFKGLLTLYFVKLKFDKKQAFNKSDLEKIGPGQYPYGFLIACHSLNILTFTTNKDIINITQYNDSIAGQIKSVLNQKAEQYDKANLGSNWSQDIRMVESL